MLISKIKAGIRKNAVRYISMLHMKTGFDADYYLNTYPDVRNAGMNPAEHFVRYGYAENRNPSQLIHTRFMKAFYSLPADDAGPFLKQIQQYSYFNALMAKPALFNDLARLLSTPTANPSEFFVFDYDKWLEKQHDVIAFYPHHPILHLFQWGLGENRLTNSGAIDRLLICGAQLGIDIESASDHDIIVSHTSPILVATFQQVYFAKPQKRNVSEKKLSIGVVLFNNSDAEMSKLARSIALNSADFDGKIEVLVTDNSPEPLPTGSLSAALGDIEHRISVTPENPGFALSHNKLMTEAFKGDADYYLGLNPDGFLLDSAIVNAVEFSMEHDDDALIEMRAEPICHPKWYDPVTGETNWISGAAFVLPRQIFTAVKGFDPEFPMYCEDVDLSFQVRQHGFRLRVAPRAAFFHDITPRFKEKNELRSMRQMIGEWYLCKKWGAEERARNVQMRLAQLGFPMRDLPRPPRAPKPSAELAAIFRQPRFGRSRFF